MILVPSESKCFQMTHRFLSLKCLSLLITCEVLWKHAKPLVWSDTCGWNGLRFSGSQHHQKSRINTIISQQRTWWEDPLTMSLFLPLIHSLNTSFSAVQCPPLTWRFSTNRPFSISAFPPISVLHTRINSIWLIFFPRCCRCWMNLCIKQGLAYLDYQCLLDQWMEVSIFVTTAGFTEQTQITLKPICGHPNTVVWVKKKTLQLGSTSCTK